MRPLSDLDVLEAWEAGLRLHPLDRTRALLEKAEPESAPSHLARLPLGQVNRRLLDLYSLAFGPLIEGTSSCPRCQTRAEFETDTRTLLAATHPAADLPAAEVPVVLDHANLRITARLPTLDDLAAAARCDRIEDARRTLLARCLLEVRRADPPASPATRTASTRVAPEDLPPGIIDEIARELAQADPAAEFTLNLACENCRHTWEAVLDPAEFLWTRLTAHARCLLLDVHTLARAYGWSETEILGLGPARRQAYLELVGPA